jgi:hypothetical protein
MCWRTIDWLCPTKIDTNESTIWKRKTFQNHRSSSQLTIGNVQLSGREMDQLNSHRKKDHSNPKKPERKFHEHL